MTAIRVRWIHDCDHPRCDRMAIKSIERQNPNGEYERVSIVCAAHVGWARTAHGVHPSW